MQLKRLRAVRVAAVAVVVRRPINVFCYYFAAYQRHRKFIELYFRRRHEIAGKRA